jgi:hypothetical protein
MPKTLLWTESGDIATNKAGDIRTINGVDAVHNQIYWLLRQAAARYKSGFDINRYAGRRLTEERRKAFKTELEAYITANVSDLSTVNVSIKSSGVHAIAVGIYANTLNGEGQSTTLVYDHGTWTYELPEPPEEPTTVAADAPQNLLDR